MSQENALARRCPFIDGKCKKTRSGGACILNPGNEIPVIICPNRLYDENYMVIRNIAKECFGAEAELVTLHEINNRHTLNTIVGNEVIVFGQGYSGEVGIRAPTADEQKDGSFKIDFLLVRVDREMNTESFVAVEVQTIDTTDSYSKVAGGYYDAAAKGLKTESEPVKAGLNWENVSKRILPQLIYKGHALRRERKASFGLYFVVPHPVFERIKTRVGGNLLEYPRGPGTITFHTYDLGQPNSEGPRKLHLRETFTTTVEQIAFAFVSPRNLPPLGIYEEVIGNKILSYQNKAKRRSSKSVARDLLL